VKKIMQPLYAHIALAVELWEIKPAIIILKYIMVRFMDVTAWKSATIPAKVNKIGKQAFNGCKKLKNINIKTNIIQGVRAATGLATYRIQVFPMDV